MPNTWKCTKKNFIDQEEQLFLIDHPKKNMVVAILQIKALEGEKEAMVMEEKVKTAMVVLEMVSYHLKRNTVSKACFQKNAS